MTMAYNNGGGSSIYIPKRNLVVYSLDTININGSTSSPTYLTGLTPATSNDPKFVPTLTGINNDEDTGAILNLTGSDKHMLGSIAYITNYTSAQGSIIAWSERSNDGVVWTPNALSYRPWDVSNKTGGSVTQKSAVSLWKHGEYLRFALALSGGGDLSLEVVGGIVNGTDVISSMSVFWTLTEI